MTPDRPRFRRHFFRGGQLCINYTNEMLQQHFNQNTFKLEEQLYQSEQIQYTKVSYWTHPCTGNAMQPRACRHVCSACA